ncbi:MAG: hypothetical protein K0S56_1256, partial [Microvirga sp.]|nr:hypothetical protein [Microvirga sp.]
MACPRKIGEDYKTSLVPPGRVIAVNGAILSSGNRTKPF